MGGRSDRVAAPEPETTRPGRMSYEQFLAWADEDTRAEWVEGEVILMSPASLDHQDLIGFLYRLISWYLERRPLGRVWVAPVQMKLSTRPSGREPDLVYVSAEHANRLRPTYIDGPADLAIEIISPDSVERDLRDKVQEYERAGIPEYWAINPLGREARFYLLRPDGRYGVAAVDADDWYESTVLEGLRLRVAWLWQRPLPSLGEVTRDLGGLE